MINIIDKDFDMECLESKIVGGGVLPISIADDKVKILLGKERFINNWRGSLKWSGFEGGRKFDEKINDTVCREFMEECLASLDLTEDTHDDFKTTMMQIISDKNYFLRVILCINHQNGLKSEKRYHITYVIEVPFQTHCVKRFEVTRQKLFDLQNKLSHFHQIQDQLTHEYPFITTHTQKIKAITNVKIDNSNIIVHYVDHDSSKLICTKLSIFETNKADIYEKWFKFRKDLHNDVKELSYIKDAIRVTYDCMGLFEDAKINDEYLEKECIKWWDVKELKTMLGNGGFCKNDFFRAYFLPVLQRSIEELEKYYPE